MYESNSPQHPLYTAPVVLPSSTLAMVSLIGAILGFTALPMIGTIVALVAGYSARKETRAVPPVASGDGMATAGIVMGWIQVGLLGVGLCCFAGYMVLVLGLVGSSVRTQ